MSALPEAALVIGLTIAALGLYDSETIERLLTVDGRDAVRLFVVRFLGE